MKQLPQRFWDKVDVGHPLGCWVWTASKTHAGYGRSLLDGTVGYVHRMCYELLIGPIPAGLDLDHLCRNPPCLNPDHLEPVTRAENSRRGQVGWHNARKTHCIEGHAFEGDNLYIGPDGKRCCITCRRRRGRYYHQAKLAKRKARANA